MYCKCMAKDLTKVQKVVFICNGDSCTKSGANENTLELREHLKQQLLNNEIHTVRTKCMGQCKQGPIVFIHPEGLWYKNVNLDISGKIVKQYLLQNKLITNNILHPAEQGIVLNPLTIKRLILKKMFNRLILKVTGK